MNLDSARVVTDFSGLTELKAKARQDEDGTLKEVAQQFEALFIQMMVERMREASFGGGLLDSQQSLFYRDMYDQQMASDLSSTQGIGLADAIERQLGGGQSSAKPTDALDMSRLAHAIIPSPVTLQALPETALAGVAAATGPEQASIEGPQQFIRELWASAENAAAELGVEPAALIAQAALETGWGKHVMQRDNGQSSCNLFGIKADRAWQGERVRKTTTEYKDGVAIKTRADFRAYESYEQSFSDYAAFLKSNPRYQKALSNTADARTYFAELQQAGYATDPAYAKKIERILESPQMQSAIQSNLALTGSVSI